MISSLFSETEIFTLFLFYMISTKRSIRYGLYKFMQGFHIHLHRHISGYYNKNKPHTIISWSLGTCQNKLFSNCKRYCISFSFSNIKYTCLHIRLVSIPRADFIEHDIQSYCYYLSIVSTGVVKNTLFLIISYLGMQDRMLFGQCSVRTTL
jgi:hypothetical protein